MDTASTLMGLGLLILFIAPVGYLLFDQAFKEKKRAKRLAFLALQKGYNLDEIENITGLSLGLDKSKKTFLLLKTAREAKLQVIELDKVAGIDLHKVNEDGHATASLDEVREISLQVKNEDGSLKKIIFYAEEEDPVTQKSERLENAMKWQKNLKHSMK